MRSKGFGTGGLRFAKSGLVAGALILVCVTSARAQSGALAVEAPGPGEYLVWAVAVKEEGLVALPPARFSGATTNYDLGTTPPPKLKQWSIYLLEQRTSLLARKWLPSKKGTPDPVKFTAADFNILHRLKVEVTGAGGKPVASATVSLQDAGGWTSAEVILPTSLGIVTFQNVPLGAAKLTVTPATGGAITKEINVAPGAGGGTPSIPIALPEVTDVVAAAPTGTTAETTAPAASAPPAAPGASGTSPTPVAPGAPATPQTPETPAPAPPTSEPAEPARAPSGGPPSLVTTLLNLLILAALLYGAYVLARRQGWTLERVLAQLGVQPIADAPVGARQTAVPPPPAAVDPSLCPYCGERKDPATGRCACTVETGPAAPLAAPAAACGEGARLIATQGTYLGQIFPIAFEASIGRDPGNAIPLTDDSTVSRRHARIWAENGGYKIHDEGSSNGTFVNGTRITDAPLRPGDEVSIGGTRFRFEV